MNTKPEAPSAPLAKKLRIDSDWLARKLAALPDIEPQAGKEDAVHQLMVAEIIKHCRARDAQGDCPTLPALAGETLEFAILEMSRRHTQEGGESVGGREGDNSSRASLAESCKADLPAPCSFCKGAGYVSGDPEGAPIEDCPICQGRGRTHMPSVLARLQRAIERATQHRQHNVSVTVRVDDARALLTVRKDALQEASAYVYANCLDHDDAIRVSNELRVMASEGFSEGPPSEASPSNPSTPVVPLQSPSEAMVERVAIAIAIVDGCGCMVGGVRVLCNDSRVDERVRNKTCICLQMGRAAVVECSSDPNTRPDRHPSPTLRAEMVEALRDLFDLESGKTDGSARLQKKYSAGLSITPWHRVKEKVRQNARAILTKADAESAGTDFVTKP